jgi:hypothetical protein
VGLESMEKLPFFHEPMLVVEDEAAISPGYLPIIGGLKRVVIYGDFIKAINTKPKKGMSK